MYTQLEIAIHQFAKRQMTWFRGMERRGFKIHWLDAFMPTQEKIERTLTLLKQPLIEFGIEQKKELLALANMRMPFGKYKGRYLVDLPEPYVVWFRQKGFPPGKLGMQLAQIYEIKVNGLEPLIRKLIQR